MTARPKFRTEIRKSRLPLRQKYWVRIIWTSNNKIAANSERYRDRRDAVNLADKLSEDFNRSKE